MVDARGYSCPVLVIMVQKAAKNNNELTVMVDNRCAVDNVTRFAENNGFSVTVTPEGDDFRLELKKD